jgi:hypothetical protein
MIIHKHFMPQQHYGHKGFITLISVLLVSVVGLTIAMSLILLGLGFSKTSLASVQSNQSKALVNACVEEALEQIQINANYTGTNNLSLGSGTCTYTVSGIAPNKSVTASGIVGTIIRKVRVSTSAVVPKILISSWQEVAN